MAQIISAKEIWKGYAGVMAYLLATPDQRKAKTPNGKYVYNISDMNRKAAKLTIESIRGLTLFLTRQTEEKVAETLDSKTVEALLRALLGHGSPEYTRRHFEIAQKAIELAGATMREMLWGEPNFPALHQMLMQATTPWLQLAKPTAERKPNGGCEGYREMIYGNLQLTRPEISSK